MAAFLSVGSWALLLAAILCTSGCTLTPPEGTTPCTLSKSTASIITLKGGAQPARKRLTKTINGRDLLISPYPVGKPGGSLTVATLGEGPKTLNPWASYDASSSEMGGMLFAGLVDTDAFSGEVYPYLAKTIAISPDQREITLTLRNGLRWSDGVPLTADDVLFTWNVILKQGLGNPSARDGLLVDGQFPEVTQVGPGQIRFKTPRPFAPLLRQLSTPIAPKHILNYVIQKGGDKAFSAAYGVQQAQDDPASLVGNGMWQIARYEPGEKLIFKRNPHFFMQDAQGQPLPYLEFYVARFVKDLNNAVLQFELGAVDTLGVPAKFVSYLLDAAKAHPDFKLYDLGPTTSTSFVALNLATRYNVPGPNQADMRQWFRDTRFRQALDWAIDREALVTNILLGAGTPLFTAESPASIFVHPTLQKGHPKNLGKAKAHLKSAGFKWNTKGELLDKQGHRVAFTLLTNAGNDEREAAGVSVQHDLAQLGIKIYFKPIEFNVLVGRIGSGDWQAILLGLTGSPLEPHGGANVWQHSGALHMFNQQVPGKPEQGVLPWELDLDKAFNAGAATLDLASRKKAYWRFQEIVYAQQPMIYLFVPRQLVAIRNRLQNIQPTPLGAFHNPEAIWIKP
ncbi:MAG: ABC transporter substrate-binding protein [Vampirovibrionales bacterium]|nr:ABC transporter substrate-binding protein [Vampirovibrionales bacterium]